MTATSGLTALPTEILHHVFHYLTLGPPSDHLATGKVDAPFRGLMFTCHRLCTLSSNYYFNHKIFTCVASDLVWELIHMNPDRRAVQAFESCIKRIQRLEVKIQLLGIFESPHSDSNSTLEKINLQLADLESLRSCLESCKTFPVMRSLELISPDCKHGKGYSVNMPSGPPISERSMYAAIFSSFKNKSGNLNLEH